MLVITEKIPAANDWQGELALPFELRQKTRLRTRLSDGREVGLFLERGQVLRGGECLRAQSGEVIRVVATPESLLHVTCATPTELTRAAYHLGNRHVPLQVGEGFLRLLDDYVLADMLLQLGAQVEKVVAPFEPEAGAYGGGHHHQHGDKDFSYQPKLHIFGAGQS